jgi:hypothetical protein
MEISEDGGTLESSPKGRSSYLLPVSPLPSAQINDLSFKSSREGNP